MQQLRRIGLAAFGFVLLAAWAAAAAPTPTRQKALEVVPADSVVVVHVRNLERTRDRLVAMVKEALPDLAGKVKEGIDHAMKEGLEGRQLKGLAGHGLFVVLTELPKVGADDQPSMAIITQVSNYDEFVNGALSEADRKTLKQEDGYSVATVKDHEVYFLHRGDYAMVSPRKEVIALLKKGGSGLKLTGATASSFLDADAALYVDMSAINREYGDQIKNARDQFFNLLDLAASQGTGMSKTMMQTAKRIYGGMFKLVTDSKALFITVSFDKDGLSLATRFDVRDDTPTGNTLEGTRAAVLRDMGKLPAGRLAYWEAAMDAKLFDVMRPMLSGLLGGAGGEKELAHYIELTKAAGPQKMMGDANQMGAGLVIGHFEDPAKAVQANLAMYEAMQPGSGFGAVTIKEAPVIKKDAETFRGFHLNSIAMELDLSALESVPGGEAILKAMPKNVHSWFGTDGKIYVQATAPNWPAARKSLEEFLDQKQTVGSEQAFQESLHHLPGDATLVGLIDVPLYAKFAGTIMEPVLKMMGRNVDLSGITAQSGKAFAGMSFKVVPTQVGFHLWIPGSAVAQVRKMYEPVFKDLTGE